MINDAKSVQEGTIVYELCDVPAHECNPGKLQQSPTERTQWTTCTTKSKCGSGSRSRNANSLPETEKCFSFCSDDPLYKYSINMPGRIEVYSEDSIISGIYTLTPFFRIMGTCNRHWFYFADDGYCEA